MRLLYYTTHSACAPLFRRLDLQLTTRLLRARMASVLSIGQSVSLWSFILSAPRRDGRVHAKSKFTEFKASLKNFVWTWIYLVSSFPGLQSPEGLETRLYIWLSRAELIWGGGAWPVARGLYLSNKMAYKYRACCNLASVWTAEHTYKFMSLSCPQAKQ